MAEKLVRGSTLTGIPPSVFALSKTGRSEKWEGRF
jgi:hypothetical protein